MPLVRIDLSDAAEPGLAQTIGDIVYNAMIEVINVPADDKFQIIAHHPSTEIVRPTSYLGIEYSDGLVVIQITLNGGRSNELKKAFYHRIATDVAAQTSVRIQDVFISLVEVPKENWSFGNGEMQYA